MNDLTKQLPFSEEDIDKGNYTASLLGLCAVNHIIDEQHLIAIRNGLDKAFVQTAEQYTRCESSTIPKRLAKQLYSSVLYQADIIFLRVRSAAKSIEILKNFPIDDVLKKGKDLILILHEENRKIFKTAYNNQLDLPVYAYRYVMDKAFDEYWTGYSARFNARDCCASIDYPLLGRPAYSLKSEGVSFIHEYYTDILYENLFCKLLDTNKIEAFLKAYGKQYRVDYKDMYFNVTEVLINNILINTLLKRSLLDLTMSLDNIRNFESMFCNHNQQQLLKSLTQALLEHQGLIDNENCYMYLQNYIRALSKDLFQRIQGKNLHNYLVITN